MNKWQRKVQRFHEKFGLMVQRYGANFAFVELRKSLIEEECRELLEAIDQRDMPAAIDGGCDLIYVVLGSFVSWGVNLDPFFAEVHRANMRKTGGPKRGDGKILKPEGWESPDIAGILAEMGQNRGRILPFFHIRHALKWFFRGIRGRLYP